jgi:hypothetical protein
MRERSQPRIDTHDIIEGFGAATNRDIAPQWSGVRCGANNSARILDFKRLRFVLLSTWQL